MPQTRTQIIAFLLTVSLGAMLVSCAKEMDNQQPGTPDSLSVADSVRAAFLKSVAEKLPGIWVRHSDDQGGIDEGFNLLPDGRMTIIGATTTLSGIRWSLSQDTLTLWMHNEPDTTAEAHVYFVKAIDDSALAIAAPNAPAGYHDNYRRRTTTVPSRYTNLYTQHFEGLIAPRQIMTHDFTVTDLFDGGVSLASDSSGVKFYLFRNGSNITPNPVREWDGRFVPGKYTVRVMFIYEGRRKAANADYTVDVEEK